MEYSYQETVAREIGGGIWFTTSLVLTVVFTLYVMRNSKRDPVTAVAFFLAVLCVGSTMRGFLLWARAMAELNGWGGERFWHLTWPIFASSVLLTAIASLACIWLLTPRPWQNHVTIITGAIAISLPLVIFYMM
jgi:hypothetical protein